MRILVYCVSGILLLVTGASALGEAGHTATPALRPDQPADGLPGPVAWLDAWKTGRSVAVPVDGQTLRVFVRASDGLFHGALPDGVTALTGRIDGAPEAIARITVSGPRAIGFFAGTPAGDFQTIVDGADQALVRGADRLALDGYGGRIDEEPVGGVDCTQAVPPLADPAGIALGWPVRTLDVAFAVDERFTVLHDDWVGDMVAMINALDGLYARDFGLDVAAVHLVVIPDSAMTGPTGSAYLAQLRDHYDAHYAGLPRDAVYASLGLEGLGGAVAGQAACIGGAGSIDHAYAVGSTEWGGPYSFTGLESLLPDKPLKIAAHEIAHLLAAHHHYANCAETAPSYDPLVTLDLCTVMINDWGLIQPRFSTLERLSSRGHADALDL